MRNSIFLMVSILMFSGCSKSTQEEDVYTGQPLALEFLTGDFAGTRAAATEAMELRSDIFMSVFPQGNATPKFLNSRYFVADKLNGKVGLTYNNDKQITPNSIIEVSPAAYDIYAAGINDGGTALVATGTTKTTTYATQNGVEYVHAAVEGKSITGNDPGTRQISLTFKRQVAMVVFELVAKANGGVTLPNGTTADLIVKEPKMLQPKRSSDATEGLLNLATGIIKPLTTVDTNLAGITPNVIGAPKLGMSYCILPLNVGNNPLTFDIQFKLKVDAGNGTPADRVFDVRNITLPQIAGNTAYGFEKGKQYKYTIEVSNTGAYFSEVNVEQWTVVNQGNLSAQ